MNVVIFSDPARAGSSIVQMDPLNPTWRTVQRKGGWQLGLAWTSSTVLVGDFWDRGQSLSHLALLVRQDWSVPAHPHPFSKLNYGQNQFIESLQGK